MTSQELNERFAKIYDGLVEAIQELEELRKRATEEVWDEATTASPIGDVLLDLEHEMSEQERMIAAGWQARQRMQREREHSTEGPITLTPC